MNRLSLKNNRFQAQDCRKLPIILEEFMEYIRIQ